MKKNTAQSGKGFKENAKTVIYAILIALFIRSFFFEPFSIPSGSMIPTLLVGDYLFVSKYTYGYSRYSLPMGVPLFEGRVWYDAPERGDVLVFKLPTDNETDYIKRVIGLPGDTVQVRNGRLYINGNIVPRAKKGEFVLRLPDGSAQRFTEYTETLPGGYKHPILEISDKERYDDTEIFVVPEDYFFMMGDNRDNSVDSRSISVGMVPKENLVGKARKIFYSNDGSSSWWEIWKWPASVRWGRLFGSIS